MTEDPNKLSLNSRLHEVWQRRQRLHWCAGFLAVLRWIVPLFLLAMALDLIIDIPSTGRMIFLGLIVGISLFQGWFYGWRNLRSFDRARTALEVERREGNLDSLFVTAVQFGEGSDVGSEELREETSRKAELKAKKLDPRRVIDFGGLHETAMMTLAIVCVLFVFGLLRGPLFVTGLARIFTPWVAVVYPTSTIIELEKGELVLKEGDRAEIEIEISGDVPEVASFILRTGEGEPREIDLEITDGSCAYLIASASRDFSYQVKAGDARSDWQEVRVIKAPRIETVKVGLEYPAYLERSAETVEALTLTVPQETKVSWQLTLDQEVRDVILIRDGEEPLPLEVVGNGREIVIDEEVDASRGYSFSWVEKENGFDFSSPRFYLQVASDQFPQVELTSPDSNLNALLGRKLDLGVRARDDHGIGSASITYRVNLRPEKTIPLDVPIENGAGEQILDWDYREVLPDLKVGDSVSFVVEVTDKYPDGYHKARSETRRITFLSREEYLAQIEKKKDRLLSRVRSTYRQERAAHELVGKLDPEEKSYLQSCQLEAIRQEMLRQQLKAIAGEVQDLLEDLKANNITEAVEADVLVKVRTDLESIAEESVAKAANLLRDQIGRTEGLDPTAAALVVNQAARELADLVLQRGIDFAREVFARESHMIAREQANIRLLAIQSKEGDDTAALADRQKQVAVWTGHLIASLRNGMRYDKRPISVLGLTRRIKELRVSGAEDEMRKLADLIESGKLVDVSATQRVIIESLLKAEFSMRTGAEFAAMMKFRSRIDSLLTRQKALRERCEKISPEDFEKDHGNLSKVQADLEASLVTSLLPPIPNPRARLFDETFPEAPPLDLVRGATEFGMNGALRCLNEKDQQAAVERQVVAEEFLAKLAMILDESSLELSLQVQGFNSLVSTAIERVSLIEDFEERQIDLLEKTEEAALDEVKSDSLAEEQQFLSEEIAAFHAELLGDSEGDQDVLPLLSRLQRVVEIANQARAPLKANKPEEALEIQEGAADILAEALKLAGSQAERLTLLQGLYSFQRSVGTASAWMNDIVQEQNDLVEATKTAKAEDAQKLIPVLKNLRQCYTDIAPVLDLVAGRLDAGTPLLFAGADLEDAILAIEDEDFLDAADAQEVAGESLEEVKLLVDAVQRQTGYVAEIVEYLHASQADAASTAFHQEELRKKIGSIEGVIPAELISEQAALQAKAEKLGASLVKASGMEVFAIPGNHLSEAHALLKSGNAAKAMEMMELAETTLGENAEELLLVITMLHGLPDIETTSASDEELMLLLDVLALASEQRDLSRHTEGGGDLKAFVARQEKLEKGSAKTLKGIFAVAQEEEGTKATQGVPPHPKLASAHEAIVSASGALKASDRAKARGGQETANEALRHFIIEQAIILETGVEGGASSDEPVLTEAETDDLSESVANFVSDFVAGEAPKDNKTEWEVLGERDRAALNQNFARELPLEYRGTLKDYYERVAK